MPEYIRDRIKNFHVDEWGEGGLECELGSAAMINEPVLIIGLGGTGIDALLHAKNQLRRRLKNPINGQMPGRLAFLAIDTDYSDLDKKRVGDIRLDSDEKYDIRWGTPVAPLKMLEYDWLAHGMPQWMGPVGTNAVRQFGRLALIEKSVMVTARLCQAVQRIWSAGKDNGASFIEGQDRVRVFILAGIGGGTGSGTFLDVAYLLREIVAKQVGFRIDVDISGMIFLPEVNACRIHSERVRQYMLANAYAALTELDFWMNPNRGRKFREKYSESMFVDTEKEPFDRCFLIAPEEGFEDYDRCMKKAGKALAAMLEEASAPDGFSMRSFEVNLAAVLQFVERPYAGNYSFFALGIDETGMPLDQMNNYLAGYMLEQVHRLSDCSPLKEQVDQFCRMAGLDVRGMERRFNRNLNVHPFPDVRDLGSFKEAVRNINRQQALMEPVLEQMLDMWAKQCGVFYNEQRDSIVKACETEIRNQIERIFVDPEHGPFYAHRMLCSRELGASDVIKTLKNNIAWLDAFMLGAGNEREQKRVQTEKVKESARKKRFVPLIAGAKYDEFVEAVFKQYDHERFVEFAKVLYHVYKELLYRLHVYAEEVMGAYDRLLEGLNEVFHSNTYIIARREGFVSVRCHIDAAVEELKNQGLIGPMVSDFLNMLLSERSAWLEPDGDLGVVFSRFIAGRFGHIMNLSIEQYYMSMLGLNTEDELRNHIRATVLPRLRSGSGLMFQSNHFFVDKAAKRSTIKYPEAAYNIGYAVKDYVNSAADLDGHPLTYACEIVPAGSSGSIVWLRMACGIPLYALKNIAAYKMAHDQFGRLDNHLGRYLKMGEAENWRTLLPSPIPEALWNFMDIDDYIQAGKNEAIRAAFRKAWDAGVILPEPGAFNIYTVGRVDEYDLNDLMNSAPLTEEQMKQICEEGVSAAQSIKREDNQLQWKIEEFVTRAKAFANNGWQPSMRLDRVLKGEQFGILCGGVPVSSYDGEERICRILAENLLHTPDIANEMIRQTEMKQKLLDVIAAYEKLVGMIDQEKKQLTLFARSLFFGLYGKVAPKMYRFDGRVDEESFDLMTSKDYALAPAGEDYYAMYLKFVSLPEAQKDVLRRTADVREAELNADVQNGGVELFMKYTANVQQIDFLIRQIISERAMDSSWDHPEIIEFYKQLLREFGNWIDITE